MNPLRKLEGRFLTATGSIDLLRMANTVPAEVFREYITATRHERELLRSRKAQG